MVETEEKEFRFGGGDDKLSFRQIIFKHIDKILEISRREFTTNITKEKIHGMYTETIREEDNRECYIQAVQSLAYLLMPFFDNKMTTEFKKLTEIHGFLMYEFSEKYKEEIKKIKEKSTRDIKSHRLKDRWALRDSQILFQELMLLLKREDFLKSDDMGSEE